MRCAGTTSHTFTGHHWPRLKAVIARTLKSTDDISARAVSAGIANVTLISVCIGDTNHKKHFSIRSKGQGFPNLPLFVGFDVYAVDYMK